MQDKAESAKPEKLSQDQWISETEERIKAAEDWNMMRQMMINVNYFVGNQWISWNRGERRVIEAPRLPGEERITVNKIRPRIMTLLSKHTKNRIKFDVVPDTNTQERIEVAKAAHKFLQYMWQELDFTSITKDIYLNNLVKGWCAVKTWYDKDAGQDITPNEGETGYEEGKKVFTGEIRARVCDPMTIFIDPAATTEAEIRWIGEQKPRDVDEIFEEHGIKVTPDPNIEYLGSYDVTHINSSGLTTQLTGKNKNMAMVRELWIRPCAKYPNGLKVTTAGGQLLDYDESAGDLPYQIFGYIPIPGSVKYDAVVKDMTPIQREINIKRSMIAMTYKKVGMTKWLVPTSSILDEEELDDETGGIIHYTPIQGSKPERAQAPDMPSFIDRDLMNNAMDIDDMSQAREISQGRLPAGLDTLGGLELMVEQENEKLTVGAQNYEQGMKKVWKRILMLIKNHFTEERQGRILGEDNEIELISFTGSDLSGGEDINIIQGSSLPEMKAAQQDRIMTLWDKGAIQRKDGTPDADTFLRMMGMGDSTELFEQHQLDENNAKMENKQFEKMVEDPQVMQLAQEYMMQVQQIQAVAQEYMVPPEMQSQYIPPMPEIFPRTWDSDDDEIHVYIHNNFRKSSDYRKMPPELRFIVDQHYQQHVDRLQAPMMQEQQAQQQMQEKETDMEHEKMQQEAQFKQQKLQIDAMNAMSKARMAGKSGK